MACGGCGRRKPIKKTYFFDCLDCGERFAITTSGKVIHKDGKYVIKGVNTVDVKHCSLNITQCK